MASVGGKADARAIVLAVRPRMQRLYYRVESPLNGTRMLTFAALDEHYGI
ncbi:hypothetical protein [Streptomyces sp. NPDC086838]